MCKEFSSILVLGSLVLSLFVQFRPPEVVTFPNYTVLFFSDPHVGRGKGLDNLTAIQRLQLLVKATNNVSANFMVDLGDLTNGWYYNNPQQAVMYQQYMKVAKNSTHMIRNVRGNHDANNSAFIQYVYPTLTIPTYYGNIAYFLLGCNERDAVSWQTSGECYYQYQANMLENYVHSASYNRSSFHFLFMHFQPNSTWYEVNHKWLGVPQMILKYLPYFSVVFCGHEGGKERAFVFGNTLVIKAAHLADSTLQTDTYLKARLEGSTKTLTVQSVNFACGNESLLWQAKVW